MIARCRRNAWIALALSMIACDPRSEGPAATGPASVSVSGAVSAPAPAPAPASVSGAVSAPASVSGAGAASVSVSVSAPASRARLSASVITIAHAGVHEYAGSRPRPTRTEPEALGMARAIAAEARKDPARFPAIARERSEDPLAPEGGDLGTWNQGDRPDLDAPVAALAMGAVSDPIPSERGFLVFRRDPPVPEARVAARRLVIAWAGAIRAPAAVARTREEALAHAGALAARAHQDPTAFEALVRAESDGWDRDRGGYLGAWILGGGRFPPAVDRAVAALADGAISPPVETRSGYVLLQRIAAVEPPAMLAGAHILIAFEGAEKARPGVRRTREEALAEAREILAEVRRDPASFGRMAAARSDDAGGKRGGDLGSFRRGTLPPPLEDALAGLSAGEVGGPVLTQYGYHVILRREAPADRDYVVR